MDVHTDGRIAYFVVFESMSNSTIIALVYRPALQVAAAILVGGTPSPFLLR